MPTPVGTQPLQLSDPLVGATLGEYRVLEPIGEGGMGVVYRGVQPVIKKLVAIKILKPHAAADSSHVKRLIDEAEAVNSIRHRNIIDIFSLGQLPDGRPYIVMEFLEGMPLDAYLRFRGKLPLTEALGLLIAICAPLGAAHRANVIHRDLKPSNIFLCEQKDDGVRYLKLLDFGLAKKTQGLGGSTAQTSQAVIAGTPDFMAPEQARGLPISARTDIYALGVMAFELLSGELPFVGPTPMDVLMKHVSAPAPSLAERRPEVPAALDALVAKMMAKEPEDRPQTVEEIREQLLAVAKRVDPSQGWSDLIAGPLPAATLSAGGTVPETRRLALGTDRTVKSSRTPKLEARPEGRKRLAVTGVALALLVAGGAAFLVRREPDPPPVPAVAPPALPELPKHSPPLRVDSPPPPSPPEPAAVPAPPPPSPAPQGPKAPVVAKAATAPKHAEPPSPEALQKRVAKLDAALKKATPAGEEPDPSAVTLLGKYKVEAMMTSTPEERARLAKSLDEFERAFLRR